MYHIPPIMSQSPPSFEPDSPKPPAPDSISAEDALPPVEAPDASFILQLFVVPGIIVLVIVMIWAMFNWLARGTDDPAQLIARLEVPNAARFQAAHQLANVLRDDRHAEFRKDSQAASRLAKILNDEIEAGSQSEKAINLRVFLCWAIGRFQVEEGLDELIKATTIQR